jgi:hypothetical protein
MALDPARRVRNILVQRLAFFKFDHVAAPYGRSIRLSRQQQAATLAKSHIRTI